MAYMPSVEAFDLLNELQDEVHGFLMRNRYYLVRRDALRRQIVAAQQNASDVESWRSVRSVFVVLALVAYFDLAHSEIPPSPPNENPEVAAQVVTLVTQARNHIPIGDIDNLVTAFTAIESVATVDKVIAGSNPPQTIKMLSPFMIIRNLPDYSGYYADALISKVSLLTHGSTAAFRGVFANDIAVLISPTFQYNYMNPPPGGWGAQAPNAFGAFIMLIERHATSIIQNIIQFLGPEISNAEPALLLNALESRLATILLAGFIHKNRDVFFAAFPYSIMPTTTGAASKYNNK